MKSFKHVILLGWWDDGGKMVFGIIWLMLIDENIIGLVYGHINRIP